jgi:uncharacterized protein (DUF302 family)
MSYYIAHKTALDFEAAIAKVKETLAAEGFGVLTEIDVAATLHKKLDIEFRPYRILGACNPRLAHHALSVEPHIGTMLPCNVIVQILPEGGVELAAIDPVESMRTVGSDALADVAASVREMLTRAIEAVK